ncbi:SHOCT-like domain-containing protein [Glycomyces albidus]|uniref:YvlB/LiaX N-terminal domain-containing protein n=1 Tax=Glycomyces albidus TaxID=2656774 RepID=A0A6L5GBI5_9ACTN|nr:hypothetical protein [Glycomyces albidus]MQM26988.1 hypothetical protein [Glycomyces albidus]
MNEQRRQILQMLAENKITADEAERLLAAIEPEESDPAPGARVRAKSSRPKYLRVIANFNDEVDGEFRVNVRVPLRLLRAGVRLTSLIPPRAVVQVNTELAKVGVPFDLGELKPQQLEELVDALDELTVDVDQADMTVKVYCE